MAKSSKNESPADDFETPVAKKGKKVVDDLAGKKAKKVVVEDIPLGKKPKKVVVVDDLEGVPAGKKPKKPREGSPFTKTMQASPDNTFKKPNSMASIISGLMKKPTTPEKILQNVIAKWEEAAEGEMSSSYTKNPKAYVMWYIWHMVKKGQLILG